MFVIPRKKGESIIIGDDIIVTVVEIRDDKVRLGIEHPPEVPVHRREVYEKIKESERLDKAQDEHPATSQ
ncbi:MAG: carbon storage regulator CsrA [Planctomycetes bacterium]|nr:carbon storage regulator CsrA [Planctomycetota bacterium]